MRTSILSVLAISLLTAPLPAVAWEHILNDYGDGQVLNAATTYDHTGGSNIIVGCLMGTGRFLIQITAESPPLPQATSEALFMMSGFPLHVPMTLGKAAGRLTATASSDSIDAFEIARSIYLASDPIEVELEGTTLFFDGGSFSNEALGAVLEGCR